MILTYLMILARQPNLLTCNWHVNFSQKV